MTHLLNFAAQKILLILLRHHNCAHCVFPFLSVILLYFIHFFSGSNSFKILKAFSLCTAARTASRPEKKKRFLPLILVKWLYFWRLLSTSKPSYIYRVQLHTHLYTSAYQKNKIKKIKKNVLYLSVNAFSTKVLIGGHYINVSYWRRDRHFTWSSEPREGLAICRAKALPSFLSYFKTLSIGPTPGIKPAISRSAVKRSTD